MQLYRKYAQSVQSLYHAALDEAFATLREKLQEQIEMIARDLRAVVVPAGEVSEVEKAPGLVREFEARLGTLKRVLYHATEAANAEGS
jgi:phage regulator Rha-like protein